MHPDIYMRQLIGPLVVVVVVVFVVVVVVVVVDGDESLWPVTITNQFCNSKNTGSDSFSPIPFWAAALTGMMPLLGIDLMDLLSFSPLVMIR